MDGLNIAEIPFEDGKIRYRYSRFLSEDGSRWIRHGPFVAYHPNGAIASEGNYVQGVESGSWRDYHDNGRVAAEGMYTDGVETGVWRYWNSDGSEAGG